MIIDQLPLLSTDVQGTDEIPIERGTSAYKTTQAALVQSVAEKSLPSGGTAGQILAKIDGTNYNTQWINPPDPSGFVSYAQAQSLTAAQKTQARDNIGANWDLLWENASPTSQFAAQTISVDYSAYERIMIFYNLTNSNYRQLLTGIDVATTGGVLMRTTVDPAIAIVDTRSFNLSGGNQITWTDCYHSQMKTGSTPVAFSTINTSCIPFRIYGVRK